MFGAHKGVYTLLILLSISVVYLSFHLHLILKDYERLENIYFLNNYNYLILENKLEKLENELWVPVEVEVTGYAPLDPDAVEGMCYSGDPTITASGSKSTPGRTIAAGSNIPFNTLVYIPKLGYRTVEDRGGMIGENKIDVMFNTKQEAIDFGRRKMVVYIKKER